MAKTLNPSSKKRAQVYNRQPAKRDVRSRPRATRALSRNGREKITPALLQEMTRRLVKEFDPEQVILFGSYAWGTPTKDSDVDIMVIVSESNETDYARMVRAYDALIGLRVPKDIFVKTRAEFERYRGVRASLQNRIAEKGKVLYDNAKEPSRILTWPQMFPQKQSTNMLTKRRILFTTMSFPFSPPKRVPKK